MEARNRNVRDWLTRIRTRQIALPRFQRGEVWTPKFVAEFLTSVARDLPVGSVLVLETAHELPFVSREIVSAPSEGETISELLLDGQQRMTALWRSLNDTFPNQTYLLHVPADADEDGGPEVHCETRWVRNGKRYPLWVDQPRECWGRRHIPIRLFNPDDELEYRNWAKEASDGDTDVELELRDLIASLRSRIANYQLPFLFLDPNTPKNVAIDVFVKLNTTYMKLTAFDVVVAQLEAAAGESLHDLVRSLEGSAPGVTHYIDPVDMVLAVEALLQDHPPNQRSYLSLNVNRVIDDWPKIVRGTRELVAFLTEEKVFDRDRLPTESVIAPLVALWEDVPETPNARGNTRILLRKYLWRAFFTTRYDRAVPTAVLQDFRAMKRVILGKGKEAEIPCFNEKEYPLPTKELLIQARWPRYRDRLARAILLLSLRGGAEDIADGASASVENIRQREYHHLYPAAWLKTRDFDEQESSRALNCILVTWRTNRMLAAREPVEYLLATCEANTLGEPEIRRRLTTHFVDFDLVAHGDYAAFLEQRAEACEDALRALCKGHV